VLGHLVDILIFFPMKFSCQNFGLKFDWML